MNRILIDSKPDKNISKTKMLKAARILLDNLMEGSFELSIAFVSEDEMADLNLSYRKKSGPTDVLAFPLYSADDLIARKGKISPRRGKSQNGSTSSQPIIMDAAILGDVVICAGYVAAAEELEVRPSLRGSGYGVVSSGDKAKFHDAVLWRLAHGILHLAGYDHLEAKDLRRMRRKEKTLMEIVQKEEWWQPAVLEIGAGGNK